MWSEDDFQYAAENTQVILAPEQQISTFGATSFRFFLISELMDQVNEVRVRDGRIHAERPQIVTPEHYTRLLLEGFGDQAQRYVEQLRERLRHVAVLRYGFQFRKTDVTENTFRESLDSVVERTKTRVRVLGRTAQRGHSGRGRRLGSLPVEVHDRSDRTFLEEQHRRHAPARFALALVAAHQLQETERIPHGMDAAHFIGVDGADRHRADAEALPAHLDQHLGLVFKSRRPLE